jgi:hypothetical protein
MIELRRELNEVMSRCMASGLDPYEHPRVRELLRLIAGTMPKAAQLLMDRQQQIEVELIRVVAGWQQPPADTFEAVFAMIKQVDDGGLVVVASITQDVDARRLLTEYAQLDEQIITMLSKEKP